MGSLDCRGVIYFVKGLMKLSNNEYLTQNKKGFHFCMMTKIHWQKGRTTANSWFPQSIRSSYLSLLLLILLIFYFDKKLYRKGNLKNDQSVLKQKWKKQLPYWLANQRLFYTEIAIISKDNSITSDE